jgi:hypothetical protein
MENSKFIYLDADFDLQPLRTPGQLDLLAIVMASFSALTNVINIAVFAHPNMKDPTFKYLLVIAIVDFSYMVINFGRGYTISCEISPILCGESAQYHAASYNHFIMDYTTSCMAIFNIMSKFF